MSGSITAHSGLFWDATTGATVGSDLENAILAAEAAAASATTAQTSAIAASTSAVAASASATSAAASGIASINSAVTAAEATITAAANTVNSSITAAATSASSAATSSTSASGFVTIASASQVAAAGSATAAALSASTASGSASMAATSATSAGTSATNAAASSVNAAASASAASGWAVALGTSLAPNGFRNCLVNGGMDVWQRGTSVVVAGTGGNNYAADMIYTAQDGTGGTCTVSQVAATGAPLAAGLYSALQYSFTGSPTGATINKISPKIENPLTLAGEVARLTFWAKADAARTVGVFVTITPGTGGSPSSNVNLSLGNALLTTAWQQFTYTMTMPAASTITPGTNGDGCVQISLTMPLNTVLTCTYTGIQFEADQTIVTPFDRHPIAVELAMAQRYYQTGTATFYGYNTTGAPIGGTVGLPAKMRSVPTYAVVGGQTLSNVGTITLAPTTSGVTFSANITATGAGNFTTPFQLNASL